VEVFEKRALRRIFGPQMKEEVAGEECVMRSSVMCTPHQIQLG
jgi:hypothetical protein